MTDEIIKLIETTYQSHHPYQVCDHGMYPHVCPKCEWSRKQRERMNALDILNPKRWELLTSLGTAP